MTILVFNYINLRIDRRHRNVAKMTQTIPYTPLATIMQCHHTYGFDARIKSRNDSQFPFNDTRNEQY